MNLALTLRLFVVVFMFGLVSKGQEFSTIHFVDDASNKKANFTIYINNTLIGSLNPNQNLDYKMYSEGFVTITLVSYYRKSISINIKRGDEIFLVFRYTTLNFQFERASKEKVFGIYKKNTVTLKAEEDKKNPIVGAPIDEERRPSQGTGFLLNEQGYVITNFHVIEDAEKVKVLGIKGDFSTEFKAQVISVDRKNDLALLQVKSSLFQFSSPPYTLKNSQEVKKAESAYVFGYPIEGALGNEMKVTDGIINSLTGFKSTISEFQISAAIQGGNSGGPVLNSDGEVIGVVVAKIASEQVDQVGYAIKSNYLRFFLQEGNVTEFSNGENSLRGKELTEQVDLISDYIYLIKTE